MAFGTNKNRLVLASGKDYIGTPGWVNPELIGVDAIRPSSHFTGDEIGSIKRGSSVTNLPAEYAMAEVGTPAKLFRKDPIRLSFEIVGEIFEVNTDLLSTIHNRQVQQAYPVTNPTTESWDITFLGSDALPIAEHGILRKTRDVSGRAFEIAMYAGISTPEDWSITMSGDDYVVMNMKWIATPFSSFTSLAEDLKNYGYISRLN